MGMPEHGLKSGGFIFGPANYTQKSCRAVFLANSGKPGRVQHFRQIVEGIESLAEFLACQVVNIGFEKSYRFQGELLGFFIH